MKPERLARRVIYESPWVNLYVDKVRFPNGLVMEDHHLLDFPCGAAAALVEDGQHNLLFVRVVRYTAGRARWEIPAGGIEAGGGDGAGATAVVGTVDCAERHSAEVAEG